MTRDKQTLNLNNLRVKNLVRCEQNYHKVNDWSPTDWACAVAGETGEMCNFVKKLRRLSSKNYNSEAEPKRSFLIKNIGKELADIVIYADLLATRLGLNLSTEIINKFNETSKKIKSNIKL